MTKCISRMRVKEIRNVGGAYGFARLECTKCGYEKGETVVVADCKDGYVDSPCWECREKGVKNE